MVVAIICLLLPHLGSASPAPECTSKADGAMEKCTAQVESAAHWITLPTVHLGLSCKERSPPYWALLEQEPHRPLRLQLELGQGQDQELWVLLQQGMDQAVEPDLM